MFTEEGSGNLPFDSCVCANDERVVQVGTFSDPKFSPDIHRTRRISREVHVAQFDAGIAGRAKGRAGRAGHGVVCIAPVAMNVSLWTLRAGACGLLTGGNLKVSAAGPTKSRNRPGWFFLGCSAVGAGDINFGNRQAHWENISSPVGPRIARVTGNPRKLTEGFARRISERCKLSKADRCSRAEIVVAGLLCRGVLLSPEHGIRVPRLQPATFGHAPVSPSIWNRGAGRLFDNDVLVGLARGDHWQHMRGVRRLHIEHINLLGVEHALEGRR